MCSGWHWAIQKLLCVVNGFGKNLSRYALYWMLLTDSCPTIIYMKNGKWILAGVLATGVVSTLAICNRKHSVEEVVSNKLLSSDPKAVLSTVSEKEREVSSINLSNVMQIRNLFLGIDPKISSVNRDPSGTHSEFSVLASCTFKTKEENRTFVFNCREDAMNGKMTIDEWLRMLMVHKACIGLKNSSPEVYNARLAEVAAEVTPKLKALGITGLLLRNEQQVIVNVDDIPKWATDRIAMEGH